MEVRLVGQPFVADRELAEFTSGLDGEGAVVSFVGIARSLSATGETVERMVLESHPRLTLRSMEQIGQAAIDRFAVSALRIVHRFGTLLPGEPIVFVAAASDHRRAAFEAADYVMDRLKTDALFWKREDTDSGRRWIEPRDDDHVARDRWSEKCPE